ncbi:MAG: YggU family protein [Acidobacteria bacterium]|nr:YggU family protein [Acidobacteriota bacterium]
MKARAAIKVQPRASRDRVAGMVGEEWKVLLRAPAVEGKANRACIEFFSRGLNVPRSAVSIVAGEKSRHKRIEIEGVAQEELERFLRGEAG